MSWEKDNILELKETFEVGKNAILNLSWQLIFNFKSIWCANNLQTSLIIKISDHIYCSCSITKMWTFEYKTQTCFILQGKLSEKSSVDL